MPSRRAEPLGREGEEREERRERRGGEREGGGERREEGRGGERRAGDRCRAILNNKNKENK